MNVNKLSSKRKRKGKMDREREKEEKIDKIYNKDKLK